jgi:hypothetical protein
MSFQAAPPRWVYRENVVVTLVDWQDSAGRWSWLIARDTRAPGAIVLTMDDGGGNTVLVNGIAVLLADHELEAICALVDEPFQGCPDMAAEVGRPHPVQR